MTTFWKNGYWRNGYWVSGHYVTRDDWDRSGIAVRYSTALLPRTQPDSQTIPNAQCPICDDDVFYYTNNAGSKVWFDELGPPWPIHGCFAEQLVATTPPQANTNAMPEWLRPLPTTIRRNLRRHGHSYVTLTYKLYGKTADRDFVIANFALDSEQHVCMLGGSDRKLYYFDLNSQTSGAIGIEALANRRHLLIAARLNLTDAGAFNRWLKTILKIRRADKHQKYAMADWLYNNTDWDYALIGQLSALDPFDVQKIANAPTSLHQPQTPVALGLMDEDLFNLLMHDRLTAQLLLNP